MLPEGKENEKRSSPRRAEARRQRAGLELAVLPFGETSDTERGREKETRSRNAAEDHGQVYGEGMGTEGACMSV